MGSATLSITTLQNDANGIAATATATAAGTVTLGGALASGGTVTLNNGQLITIDPGANDNSGVNFAITGTDPNGRALSETITGGNAAANSTTEYFKTVTSITNDGAITGSVDIGVLSANGAATKICPVNWRSRDFKVGLAGEMTGTLTWKVQATFDDVQTVTAGTEIWHDHDTLTGQTANATGNYEFPPRAIRGVLTAYTSGTFDLQVLES